MKKSAESLVCLVLTFLIAAIAIPRPQRIPISSAKTVTFEVGVYWDKNCAQRVSSIEWGALYSGATERRTVYVRNEYSSSVTLFLITKNWNPVNASDHVSLSWDYTEESIGPGEVIPTVLTLSISPDLKTTTSFSFDIVLATLGGSSTRLSLSVPGIGEPNDLVTVNALLTDSSCNPLPGQQVHFYISGHPLSGFVSPTAAYTNVDGVASANLTLPSVPSTIVLDAVYYGSDQNYASSELKTVAVLPIYQTTITAEASPVNIESGKTSLLTFRLNDERGNPLANQSVSFKTTAGTLSSARGFTDGDGKASVVLTAPSLKGQVVVFASFAGLITTDAAYQPSEGGVGISVSGTMSPTILKLTIPTSLASPGKTVTLHAFLSDHLGVPLAGKAIHFVTGGIVAPQTQSKLTDSEGVATVTVTLPNTSSIDVVNCYFAGDSSYLASEQLKVVAALPIFQTALAATVSPENIVAGTASTITFTLRDERGDPLPRQRLVFLTTVGNLSASSGITDSNGVVAVALTASETNIAVVSASFGGYLSDSVFQPSMSRRGISSHVIDG